MSVLCVLLGGGGGRRNVSSLRVLFGFFLGADLKRNKNSIPREVIILKKLTNHKIQDKWFKNIKEQKKSKPTT